MKKSLKREGISYSEDFIFTVRSHKYKILCISIILIALIIILPVVLTIKTENPSVPAQILPFINESSRQIVIGGYLGAIQVFTNNLTLTHNFTAHYKSNKSNCIERVKYLPGGYIASISADTSVKIWSTTNWSLVREYNGHTDDVYGIDYIREDIIATGGFDNTIQLWRISNGELKLKINTTSWIYCLKYLPTNGYLASGDFDGNINIWDITTGALVRILGYHSNRVFDLLLINNDLLASSSDLNTIVFWDLKTFTNQSTINAHGGQIWTMVLVSHLNLLISASTDETIKIWNLKDMSLNKTIQHGHEGYIFGLSLLSHDVFVSVGLDGYIKRWLISTGLLLDSVSNGLLIQAVETF